MASCLGLYIEDKLIKYAKVSKSNEDIKVESFGVKFYDNITTAVKQIVEETYSFKLPISINATDELFNEIEVFSLLSERDIKNVIKTEFESICTEKEINKNIYEQRYVLANSERNAEKIKAIHIATPKTSLEQRKNQFLDHKISNISPISIAITNLLKKDKKGTDLIINIEKGTTFTKIKNGTITSIKSIDIGAEEILNSINKKENSYAKAYNVCKDSTIYTEMDKDLQYEENEYLEDIMPVLYNIVSEIRNFIEQSMETIDKVYITGTGAIINNIDIYFQEYLKNITCEILKPDFINNNSKINMKDYIEVNSAISLGVYALEKDSKNINFLKNTSSNKIWEILNYNIGDINPSQFMKNFGSNNSPNLNRKYNTVATLCLMIVVMYLAGTITLDNLLNNKLSKAKTAIEGAEEKINEINEYNKKFNDLTEQYKKLNDNIEDIKNINREDRRYRNAIPNLLNNIMTVIPRNVQLISIDNTSSTHIVITAKSKFYEQIAYFKTKLRTEEILKNVISDTGSATDGYVTVTIEGELP